MATFTVNTTADVVDGNYSQLSLREAVNRANLTTAADTIVFSGAVEGQTLVLTGGELVLNHDTTVDGDQNNDGGRVSLDGNGSSAHDVGSRHLSLEGSNTDIVLNDLTFTNAGNSGGNGGSIFVSNVNLSISGCNFSENSITDYGGAIYAYGASYIAISNSSFVGNDAFYAGGGALCANLYGNGRLVIRNTEFVDNYAYYGGGAIKIYGGSTIIENSARGE